MNNSKRPANDSIFSHVVIFIVGVLLFTSTTVKAFPDDSSVITQVLKNLYDVLFDSSGGVHFNTAGGNINLGTESSTGGDSTVVTGRDPWDSPPTPPPPPTQQ